MESYSIVILFLNELYEIVSVLRGLAVELHPHCALAGDDVELGLLNHFLFHCFCCCTVGLGAIVSILSRAWSAGSQYEGDDRQNC